MLHAVFVSPRGIRNHRGLEPYSGRPALQSKYTQKAVVLANSGDLYKAGEDVVAQLEHDAHISVLNIDRLVVHVGKDELDIIEPLAKAFRTDSLVWVVCQEAFDEAKMRIQAACADLPNIIRAKPDQSADQLGRMVESWLFEGKIRH